MASKLQNIRDSISIPNIKGAFTGNMDDVQYHQGCT